MIPQSIRRRSSGGIRQNTSAILRSTKRAVITRILHDDPAFHGLFVVSDAELKQWELVNAKPESKVASRFILRRMAVGDKLQVRTPTERLALVDLTNRGEPSAAEIQDLHDDAFDVDRVTQQFFSDYCRVFDEVCQAIKDRNRLPPETAEHETLILLNRLLFLYSIQRKGWLSRRRDYLAANFKEHSRRSGRGEASPKDVDYGGSIALVDSCKSAGIKKFIMVTSGGVTWWTHPVNLFSGGVLKWKRKAEQYLRVSGLTHVIVRPNGGLTDKPGNSNKIIFTQNDGFPSSSISRDDIAIVCVKALMHKEANNKTFEVKNSDDGMVTSAVDWSKEFGAMMVQSDNF